MNNGMIEIIDEKKAHFEKNDTTQIWVNLFSVHPQLDGAIGSRDYRILHF